MATTVSSKLALRSGCHHLVLHQSYRYFTAFSTYLTFHHYKRLIFGINATAAGLFQHTIKTVKANIPGAKSINDDIVTYGKAQSNHDRAGKSNTWLPQAGLTTQVWVQLAQDEFWHSKTVLYYPVRRFLLFPSSGKSRRLRNAVANRVLGSC